jgi:hypothetical protein
VRNQEKECAIEIHIAVVIALGVLKEILGNKIAGRVDKVIDVPGLTIDLGNERFHRFGIVEIRSNGFDFAFAASFKLTLACSQFVLLACDKDDGAAIGNQQARGREPHTARPANDVAQGLAR